MSETFEKRPDGANRRQTRIDKERKAKKKTRLITLSVVAILVLLFAGAMFINSKLIRRTLPAIAIGDVNFSAAEYDYYFSTAFTGYQNQMYSYFGEGAGEYLPSNEIALSSQIYNDETGETWEEYFSNMALQQMIEMAKIYSAATAANFKLPDDASEEISNQITQLREQADMYGFPSFISYLQQIFGSSITEGGLRKIMERAFLTSSYSRHVYDSFNYSPDALAAYYSENAGDLDKFVFRVFTVDAEPPDYSYDPEDESADSPYQTEEEYNEAYDAAYEEAVAEARETAASIVSGINSEDDFINAAKQYNELYYEDPDSTLVEYAGSDLINLEFGDWLQDSARVRGDVMTMDNESGSYIVCFVERDRNEYRTVQMRQIQVVGDMVDSSIYEEGEDDPEYLAAEQKAEADAEAKAADVLARFTGGGATEEKLLELMEEFSDDPTEGGLYENIMKGNMPMEMNDWLFDSDRKHGDYTLIKSDYGHHLMFFMGFGEKSCDVIAESALREKAFEAWSEGLVEAEPVMRWAFNLTQKH